MVKSTNDLLIEAHPAASIAGCQAIERRLQSWGLDLHLVAAERPDPMANSPLPVTCLFTGADADPEADRWQDLRQPQED